MEYLARKDADAGPRSSDGDVDWSARHYWRSTYAERLARLGNGQLRDVVEAVVRTGSPEQITELLERAEAEFRQREDVRELSRVYELAEAHKSPAVRQVDAQRAAAEGVQGLIQQVRPAVHMMLDGIERDGKSPIDPNRLGEYWRSFSDEHQLDRLAPADEEPQPVQRVDGCGRVYGGGSG